MSKNHYPRTDASFCPNPDKCHHTTDVPNESCECCGFVNSPLIGTAGDVMSLLDVDMAGVWELVVDA